MRVTSTLLLCTTLGLATISACGSGDMGAGSGTGGGASTGGGAATGGGTATGGGGGTSCRAVSTYPLDNPVADYWAFRQSAGHYNLVYFGMDNTAGTDTLGIEVLYANDVGPTPPFTKAITTATYSQCSVCTVYKENCDVSGNCKKVYLGRSGNVSITRADRDVAGRIQGSADTLYFQQWDLNADTIAGEACIIVSQVPAFDVGWNQDGGSPPP